MAIGKQPDVTGEDDEDGGSIFAEINITPLTDVFLVMVVIFMISALAVQAEQNLKEKEDQKKEEKQKQSGLKLDLPPGKAAEIDQAKASLILSIPIQGDVEIDQGNGVSKPVPDADIDKLFQHAYSRDKSMQVVLKADKGVQHGRVVNLMERAKQAGLSKLAIGTAGGG